MPETETLRCKAGHDFHRPRTRGRKPEWCPVHRPEPNKPAERLTEAPATQEEHLQKAREVKQEKIESRRSQIDQKVQEILDRPFLDEELRRKLSYAHKNVNHPGMTDTRDALIREASRIVMR